MDKTLEFTTKSPQQIKQGDTETMFTFICKNAGSVVDLTQATSITAKIGNASGYLRSQPITITSLAGLNPGWLNLQPTPALISGLPDGDYQLEIWVIDQAGTSIYPSDKPLGFTISNNIESESGASITTIAFDDFVEAMNKAASTIAKGEKGDPGPTGTVDNAGLTSAPAFVDLQTQVNNSAVGTNLYIDTRDLNNSSAWNGWFSWYKTGENFNGLTVMGAKGDWNGLGQTIQAKKGETYTFSIYARYKSGTGNPNLFFAPSGVVSTDPGFVQVSLNETWQRITGTFTITADGPINARVEETGNNTNTLLIAGPKLERGTKATDWCPNPSEILTQSDYAKIQAAIVALGGSLK